MNILIVNLSLLGSLIPFLASCLIVQQPIDRREDCVGVRFIIQEQPGAPAQLSIKKTSCKSPYYMDVELAIKNTSAKIINAYEVEFVDTYEHVKGSRSAQGVRGREIVPEQNVAGVLGAPSLQPVGD